VKQTSSQNSNRSIPRIKVFLFNLLIADENYLSSSSNSEEEDNVARVFFEERTYEKK
jgi:hypothetical protein